MRAVCNEDAECMPVHVQYSRAGNWIYAYLYFFTNFAQQDVQCFAAPASVFLQTGKFGQFFLRWPPFVVAGLGTVVLPLVLGKSAQLVCVIMSLCFIFLCMQS